MLLSIVTDDSSVFTVATVVHAEGLLDAVREGSLHTRTFDVVHMDGSLALTKVCHVASLSQTTANQHTHTHTHAPAHTTSASQTPVAAKQAPHFPTVPKPSPIKR